MPLTKSFLLRVSPLPFDTADKLAFDAEKFLQEVTNAKNSITAAKNDLLSILEINIPLCVNDKFRNNLINLKRDIFNNRNLKFKAIDDLALNRDERLLYEKLAEIFLKYELCLVDKNQKLLQLSEQIDSSKITGFAFIKNCFKKKDFNAALLLSSIDLHLKFSKKSLNEKNSLAIAKYYYRALTKTSPFSCFTLIGFGAIDNKEGSPFEFPDMNKKSYHVRLNNYLLFIFQGLLETKYLFPYLNFKRNSTITLSSEGYKFIANCNNSESIQFIAKSVLVDSVFYYLNTAKSFSEIFHHVNENFLLSKGDFSEFINKLLKFGFIEVNYPMSPTSSNWIQSFDEFILELLNSPVKSQSIRKSLTLIRKYVFNIQVILEHISIKNYFVRKELFDLYKNLGRIYYELLSIQKVEPTELKAVKARLKDQCRMVNHYRNTKQPRLKVVTNDLNVEINKFQKYSGNLFSVAINKIVFNDCGYALDFKLNQKNKIELITQKLDLLINLSSQLINPIKNVSLLRLQAITNMKFGEKTSLLNLYFAYQSFISTDIKNQTSTNFNWSEDERQTIKEYVNSQLKPEYQDISVTEKKWLKFIDILLKDFEDPHTSLIIHSDNLPQIEIGKHLRNSTSCFIQGVFDNTNKLRQVVWNATLPGYGKLFSRFLSLSSNESHTEGLRQINKEHFADIGLAVQNIDNSYFNGNIAEQILDYTFDFPNSGNDYKIDKISINNLFVEIDGGQLILKDQCTQKRIFPIDTGFLASHRRSSFFKFLDIFMPSNQSSIGYLCHNINNHLIQNNLEKVTKSESVILPRLVLDDLIVLQRKTWMIHKNKLPVWKESESEADYLIRINTWRINLKMDAHVFITANSRLLSIKEVPTDTHKPFYVDFTSIISLKIFNSILNDTKEHCIIQEFYPSRDEMLTNKNKKYVSEMLIQWN